MSFRFSANLGFLWQELPLIERVRAAKRAGFAAVECHWPYETPAEELLAVLQETGLHMVGINAWPGNIKNGEFGLSALPERQEEARAAIDQAIDYACKIGALNIHVMAGIASGNEAWACYIDNLIYACKAAQINGITILIEVLNDKDAPGYFLQSTDQVKSIIKAVGQNNLKFMFDCYHLQIMEGNLPQLFETLQPIIGHIQIASVPDRHEPDQGKLDYKPLLTRISVLGWDGLIGAEYTPAKTTDDGLGWMKAFNSYAFVVTVQPRP